jgi:hypothetical protein
VAERCSVAAAATAAVARRESGPVAHRAQEPCIRRVQGRGKNDSKRPWRGPKREHQSRTVQAKAARLPFIHGDWAARPTKQHRRRSSSKSSPSSTTPIMAYGGTIHAQTPAPGHRCRRASTSAASDVTMPSPCAAACSALPVGHRSAGTTAWSYTN